MKKYFSYKIDIKNIEKAQAKVKQNFKTKDRINKGKNYFYYLFGITVASSYIYFLMKASGLFKKLEIDKKYKNYQKSKGESYGVDIELNDKKIKEFTDKWGINYALKDYEEKLKYGNKELNKKQEIEDDKDQTLPSEIQIENKLDQINIEEKSDASNKTIGRFDDREEVYEITKGTDYQQIKIYEEGKLNNPDPRIMGTVIIFDSRLDRKNMTDN